jgi:hypothetical protein
MQITLDNTIINLDNATIADENINEALKAAGYPYPIEADIVDGGEYVTQDIINPENTKKLLLSAIIDATDSNYERAKKELTTTDRYHDWSHTIADRVSDALVRVIEREQEYAEEEEREPRVLTIADLDEHDRSLVAEYNQHVRAFNQYGDKPALTPDAVIAEQLLSTLAVN